jgi:hypothetical protein
MSEAAEVSGGERGSGGGWHLTPLLAPDVWHIATLSSVSAADATNDISLLK